MTGAITLVICLAILALRSARRSMALDEFLGVDPARAYVLPSFRRSIRAGLKPDR
jgi:hypothetical protein